MMIMMIMMLLWQTNKQLANLANQIVTCVFFFTLINTN